MPATAASVASKEKMSLSAPAMPAGETVIRFSRIKPV